MEEEKNQETSGVESLNQSPDTQAGIGIKLRQAEPVVEESISNEMDAELPGLATNDANETQTESAPVASEVVETAPESIGAETPQLDPFGIGDVASTPPVSTQTESETSEPEEHQDEETSTSTENGESKYEEVEVDKSKFEEVITKNQLRTDSYYDGSVIELIGYRLLSILITIITIGIAKPWADCMIIRDKVSHTVLNGKRLVFEGKGSSYFVQKFKWAIFTIFTLGIYSFWIPINKLKWQISHIHFEDEHYVQGESVFEGKLGPLVGINFLCFLITFASFGLLYPVARCFKMRWISKHTIINRKRLIFKGKALNFFLNNLLWYFLMVITAGIFTLWLGKMRMKWQVKNTFIKLKDEVEEKNTAAAIVTIVLGVVAVGIIIGILVVVIPKLNFNFELDQNLVDEMRETYVGLERELAGKVFEETDVLAMQMRKNSKDTIRVINSNTLTTFTDNGGKAKVKLSSASDYDRLVFKVTLKKNGITCESTVDNYPKIYEDYVECYTFGENILRHLPGVGFVVQSEKTNDPFRFEDYEDYGN